MGDIIPAVNHISQQSDRWLFIGLLVVCGFALWILGRLAIGQIKSLLQDLREERKNNEASRTEHAANLVSIIGEFKSIAQRSNDVIDNNTKAMQEVAREVAFCRTQNGRN